VREADRIVLARPESNTLGILGLEGAFIRGSLQLQAEAHYAQYQGRVDGYGGGGYVYAAWLVTGGRRTYNARWGTLAPYNPAGRYSVEVFARLSHTRGDDDTGGWNDFKAVTLGSSFFFRNLRCSINVLYGESREPIATEDSGLALNVRAQYLF
jgi:phosphate-selective porin